MSAGVPYRSLTIEHATRGIKVNAVAPGVIKMPLHPVEAYAKLGALHSVGHMGEMSGAVVAFPLPRVHRVRVDGGQRAGH